MTHLEAMEVIILFGVIMVMIIYMEEMVTMFYMVKTVMIS